LEIACSTGTYIRTLADDLGNALGVGGMMRSLRRLWIGDDANPFRLEEAWTLEALAERAEANALGETVLSARQALRSWAQITLEGDTLTRFRHGQAIFRRDLPEIAQGDSAWNAESNRVAVCTPEGEVCAVARLDAEGLQPVKVLLPLQG
jgi:tRNA pseudouridine55 synthase